METSSFFYLVAVTEWKDVTWEGWTSPQTAQRQRAF